MTGHLGLGLEFHGAGGMSAGDPFSSRVGGAGRRWRECLSLLHWTVSSEVVLLSLLHRAEHSWTEGTGEGGTDLGYGKLS